MSVCACPWFSGFLVGSICKSLYPAEQSDQQAAVLLLLAEFITNSISFHPLHLGKDAFKCLII